MKYIPIGLSILSGGLILGQNMDKINVLCEEYEELRREHSILREKVYDIYTTVRVIDEKLTNFIEINKNK